jgi:hypothetical protein
LQFKHLWLDRGGFIGSQIKRNQVSKTAEQGGKKIHPKKTQTDEEGRRVFRKSSEENPNAEDPFSNRPFCATSRSLMACAETLLNQ